VGPPRTGKNDRFPSLREERRAIHHPVSCEIRIGDSRCAGCRRDRVASGADASASRNRRAPRPGRRGDQRGNHPDRHEGNDPEWDDRPPRRQDRGGRRERRRAGWRGRVRRDRQVRLAGHHRRPLAYRGRLDQRGRHDGVVDDGHRRRARSHGHQYLSRPRRRSDDRQRAARQREPDWRQEQRDQAALGQDARGGAAVRRGDARHQVRARGKSEGHAAVRPDGTAPLSGDARRRRVRHSRRLHAREGLSAGMARLREEEGGRPGRPRARAKASGSCTHTATAPTKS
jgi:hypothetical protein